MPSREWSAENRAPRLGRVLHAIGLDPSRKFGSLEEQIQLLAQGFRERGGNLLPLFEAPLAGRTRIAFASAGIEADALDLRRFEPRALRRLLGLIRLHRIQAVHWSFYHPANPYVRALALLRPRLHHYLTDHISRDRLPATHSPSWLRRVAKRRVYGRYRRILCVSGFVRDCLVREGVSTELVACPHFINAHRFRPDLAVRARVREELAAGTDFVVLAVAHLIPEKGIDVLLRALARHPSGVSAWIVGEGPEEGRLKRLREELGLSRVIRFLGNQDEVQRFMQAADCLVCPSVWQEAAGLVNIEALSCGLPVVASRVGGIPEIIDHGRTGFLFPPGNVDELAEPVRRLVHDRELRASMARAGRSIALERHSAERRMQDHLDFHFRGNPKGGVDA